MLFLPVSLFFLSQYYYNLTGANEVHVLCKCSFILAHYRSIICPKRQSVSFEIHHHFICDFSLIEVSELSKLAALRYSMSFL